MSRHFAGSLRRIRIACLTLLPTLTFSFCQALGAPPDQALRPIDTPRGQWEPELKQIRAWRRELSDLSQVPRGTPDGWTKSRVDPSRLVTALPGLKIKPQYVLRAYLFKEGSNSNGFVWALPRDAEFPEPDDCPRLESHFLHPPKPFDALDDVMEAITGDGSPASYMQATLLRRAFREFGAGWHGLNWSTHSILADSPWRMSGDEPEDGQDGVPVSRPQSAPDKWQWLAEKPRDWRPQVTWDENQVVVQFHTYTALGRSTGDGKMERERILWERETYRRGNYRPLVRSQKLAEGPDAIAF